MYKIMKALPVCCALSLAAPLPSQAERSPVFGTADVAVMTTEAANDVTAQGYYANYYGYYAYLYGYYGYYYAYLGRYAYGANTSSETNAYYYSYIYLNAATSYAYYAYLYSYYRM